MKGLAVIVPFFKRKELTTLCFKHLERQQKKYGFSVFVCGDNLDIVPSSFNIVECDNDPLGNKQNELLRHTKEFDAVCIIGSDDFVSDSVFELYAELDLTKEVFYGFDNCHVYSVWHRKLGTDLAYSKSGNTIGVGRLWTKPTLTKMDYQLWNRYKNSGLDGDSKNRMLAKGIEEVKLSYKGHFVVDVKQDYNITAPELVNTCDTIEDENMIIAELGAIGNEILALKEGTSRQIRKGIVNVIKQKLKRNMKQYRMLRNHGALKKDLIINLEGKQAEIFVSSGFAELVVEPTKKKCTDCDEKPCSDCEKHAESKKAISKEDVEQ